MLLSRIVEIIGLKGKMEMDTLFLHVLGCETRTAVQCDEKKIGKISESSLFVLIVKSRVLFYLLMPENRLDCS